MNPFSLGLGFRVPGVGGSLESELHPNRARFSALVSVEYGDIGATT